MKSAGLTVSGDPCGLGLCNCGPEPWAPWDNRETLWSPDSGGPDGRPAYRYTLWRHVPAELFTAAPGRVLMIVGLNPSTATETLDDPTIRRCKGFARAWGFEWLCMTNAFAFRATEPADMKAIADPVGPDNDMVLAQCARRAQMVVAAWGTHGQHRGRDKLAVATILQAAGVLRCFTITKDGHPGHPLYLPADTQPKIFQERT